MVSTSTFGVGGAGGEQPRVASMPSMPGIRMSISTTSGRSARADARRPRPVGGLADHLDVGLRVEDHREAGPDQLLVVGEQHPDRHAGSARISAARTAKPPLGRRTGVGGAAAAAATRSRIPSSPFRRASAVRPGGAPAPVVDDLHRSTASGVADDRTRAPARPACLSALVSDSCTIR